MIDLRFYPNLILKRNKLRQQVKYCPQLVSFFMGLECSGMCGKIEKHGKSDEKTRRATEDFA